MQTIQMKKTVLKVNTDTEITWTKFTFNSPYNRSNRREYHRKLKVGPAYTHSRQCISVCPARGEAQPDTAD